MRLSTWAMNRIVEQQMAGDKARPGCIKGKREGVNHGCT